MDPQKNKDGVNKKKVRPDAPIYVPPAGRSQVTTQKNQEVE